jgi:drug/metabolite transporter (DMT)-like permease
LPDVAPGSRLAGIPFLVLAMLLWPVVEALAGFLTRGYSPFEVVWVRYGTHLLLMLVLWSPGGPARLIRARRPGLQMLRGLTMLGMPAFFVLGATRMPVDTVMAVFWITPLLAMLLASRWLGERVSAHAWTATALACAGAVLVVGPSALPRRSIVLPLAMAVCFALYQVLTRALRDETTATRLFYTAFSVWLPLGLAAPWFWTTPGPRDLALMMAIGVLGFLFLLALDRALDSAPVTRLAPFAVAQPIWSVVVEATVGRDRLSLVTVTGVVLVLVAWVALIWPLRSRSTATLH